MRLSLYLILFSFGLLPISTQASVVKSGSLSPSQSQIYPAVSLLPNGSRASLIISKLTSNNQISDSVVRVDSAQLFPPASTLKLITALAAKLELGDDFVFETSAYRNNRDLFIKFSGDPSLKREDIRYLLTQLEATGIQQIDNIWFDGSIFSGYERGVGWPWDILGVCYSAPSSAISLDGNCVQASISTSRTGSQSTSIFVPKHQPISVTTQAIALSKQQKESQQCELELIASSNNHYEISGCLVERDKPLPLKFALQDTTPYVQSLILQELKNANIQFDGQFKIGTPPPNSMLVATHQSQPLPKLLETMLRRSNNLYADNIAKTIGHHFYLQPGSFTNGTNAIKQIIFAHTGIDLNDARFTDGSGLSRNNRLTADDMESILTYIASHEDELNLITLMPTSGESGTLKYRRSMRKAPIKGNLIAKSGSLYGSANMAGFGTNKDGDITSVFVQFVSDYHPPKPTSDVPIEPSITQFERRFYQDVITLSQ